MKDSKEKKLCKYCQTEIPKKAKICPNCKKKQKGFGCLTTVIVVILIFVIIGAIGSQSEKKPVKVSDSISYNSTSVSNSTSEFKEEIQESSETTEIATSEEESVFHVGETAEMNDIQITLVSYEESNGSEYNTPSEGNVFLLANFEISNNSDSELGVSSMASFEAYADDYALNYSISALIEKQGSTQLDGTVAPGKKMNGWIGYEVPADWSNIEIHFTDNVWSNNKFVFEIEK